MNFKYELGDVVYFGKNTATVIGQRITPGGQSYEISYHDVYGHYKTAIVYECELKTKHF